MEVYSRFVIEKYSSKQPRFIRIKVQFIPNEDIKNYEEKNMTKAAKVVVQEERTDY